MHSSQIFALDRAIGVCFISSVYGTRLREPPILDDDNGLIAGWSCWVSSVYKIILIKNDKL